MRPFLRDMKTIGVREDPSGNSAISESAIRATLQSASNPRSSWTASTMTFADMFGTDKLMEKI